MKNPILILIDELLANLDSSFQQKYNTLFEEYLKNKTVIVATHKHEMLDLYDNVIRINKCISNNVGEEY